MQFDWPEISRIITTVVGLLIIMFIVAYIAYRYGQKSNKTQLFSINKKTQEREFQRGITANVLSDIFTTGITSPQQAMVHLEAVKEVLAKEYENDMARLKRLYTAEKRGVPTPIESEHGLDYIYIKLDSDSEHRVASEIEQVQYSLDQNRMIAEALSQVILLLQQVTVENQQDLPEKLVH